MTAIARLDIPEILKLRQHLSIIHHVPGRIRLRFGPALWGIGAKVERKRIQELLDQLHGIRNVRLNAAVASAVIEYDPKTIPPQTGKPFCKAMLKKPPAC